MMFPVWSIPAFCTIVVLAWAYFMPTPHNSSPFAMNIDAFFSAMFRLVVVVFVTMGSWLVYFIWRAA